MIELTMSEARALGVLIEKALTTPDLYPLTLNALTNGCNQKNNRDPVMALSEDDVLTAVMGLRAKGLLVQMDSPGTRASKYRHLAAEKLQLSVRQLAVLAELLMRGPQTIGELRGRASRMHAMETLEIVQSVLDELMGTTEPMVQRIAPRPGDRAERYLQLLCPDAVDAAMQTSEAVASPTGEPAGTATLSQRVAELETQVQQLRSGFRKLCEQLGVENLI